jgi:outer membrane immunogenic protein
MAKCPARSAVPERSARPKISGFRPCARGYAVDRILFYGTAGGALGDIAPGQSGNFQRTTKGGWTSGAGLEAALTENLTARIEYLYMKLGNTTCTSPAASGSDLGLPGGSSNPNDTVKFSTSMIRLGLDYKFR